MPTTITRVPVELIECFGVIVPFSSNSIAEKEAYKEIALGGCLALVTILPFWMAAMAWMLWVFPNAP